MTENSEAIFKMINNIHVPQVKVCGLTRVEEALGCSELGVHAIGCVFYPKSPRFLSNALAKEICTALPQGVIAVGVFVNETFAAIMQRVERCHLSAVQLHGQESPELVRRLNDENLQTIKALFVDGNPSLKDAARYPATTFLVECGRGAMPGGNAMEWNWSQARQFGEQYPLVIAGGLSPENVSQAIQASVPHAVDVSSGVEQRPGRKHLGKVKAFMSAVSRSGTNKKLRKIF